MRFSFFSVLLISLLYLKAGAQQAANHFRRVDISHGLSNNQINTVFSDSQGFMWFATMSGLNRYDGSSFRVFKNNPDDPASLPENSIHRIYEDPFGYLWLFATSGLFFIYDPVSESFSEDHKIFHLETAPAKTGISSVRNDREGNLWISTFQDGIYYYNTKQSKIVHLSGSTTDTTSLSSSQIEDIAFCSNGMAYAINHSGTIDVIDIKSLRVSERISYTKGALYSDINREYRLFIDKDNDIWIYSVNAGDGVYFIRRESGRTTNLTHQSSPVKISNPNITGLIMDNQGQIWIGTEHGGINILNKND